MLTDDNIEELKQRVEKFRPDGIRERRTREWLIDFALRFLGWHVSEYRRVSTEYIIAGPRGPKESKVDYALFAENGNPAVFVEAKRLDGIGEAGVEQLRRYAFAEISRKIAIKGTRNRELASFASLVLTDGNVWKFYPLSHEKGVDYHPQWCHTLNLDVGDAYKIREDLNNLLDIQKVSSGESSKYLEKLFRLDLTGKASEKVLEKHQIKRDVKLVFGEQREKIADLAKMVMKEVEEQECDPEQKEVEEAVLKYIIPSPSSIEMPDAKQNHDLENVVKSKDKRGKPKKLEVKWGNKNFTGKKQTLVMRNVIAEFLNVFGAEKCTESEDHDVPTVMAKTEVDKYKEGRKSITCGEIPGHPNYVYLTGLGSTDKANRLNLLAKALDIPDDQFEVKLDGKLHR